MRTMSDAYRTAVYSDDRSVDIFVSIGSGIDNTAADDLSSVSGSFLPLSNTGQVADAIYSLTAGMAVFEGDGIPTAESAGITAPPVTASAYPPETGLWSAGISDADGNITFTVTLTFSKAHTSALRVYTDGPEVLSATVAFSDGSSSTQVTPEMGTGCFTVADARTYTTVVIAITKIATAYCHARIAEIEFGASKTLSTSEMAGEVSVLDELDPTELSAPMRELDLSVINVSGDFDADNPSSRLSEVDIGTPINLSFTVNASDGSKYTVPCGRYVIAERSADDLRVSLVAFDARYPLTSIYRQWTISADTSIGAAIDAMLTLYDVPHLTDTALHSLMPDAAVTFDDQSSLADDLLTIQQAYGVYCLPDRDDTIHVTRDWPSASYGQIPGDTIYAWPAPQQATSYNAISIGYTTTDGTLYVEEDLRTDTAQAKNILEIGSNPMITTQARAQAVLDRIKARLMAEETETDWRGDPAMDLGDTVSIPGRWTQESPRSYAVRKREITYDGTFREKVRGTR